MKVAKIILTEIASMNLSQNCIVYMSITSKKFILIKCTGK